MSERDDEDDEDNGEGEDLVDSSGELVDPLGNPRRGPLPKLPAVAPRGDSRGAGGDLLAHYLSEVRRYALLDPEEERKVALSWYEQGDPSAAERLVTANLRLVVKIAF